MVRGLRKFREQFARFEDRYVLIGGTAASLAMEALGAEFRATKDLDMVLIIEALDKAFAEAFWEFVGQGGYRNRQRSTGKRLFYRFQNPTDASFPAMLELFSRVPDLLGLNEGSQLAPIPVDDEVSSLSAILMADDYYHFVLNHRHTFDGLSAIGPEALIPLKARAFVDLSLRKTTGEAVDARNIRKHKNDIFRLFTVLDPSIECTLPVGIKRDLSRAFEQIRTDSVNLKALGIRDLTPDRVIETLAGFYGLDVR